jgi:hypothetical protein
VVIVGEVVVTGEMVVEGAPEAGALATGITTARPARTGAKAARRAREVGPDKLPAAVLDDVPSREPEEDPTRAR